MGIWPGSRAASVRGPSQPHLPRRALSLGRESPEDNASGPRGGVGRMLGRGDRRPLPASAPGSANAAAGRARARAWEAGFFSTLRSYQILPYSGNSMGK